MAELHFQQPSPSGASSVATFKNCIFSVAIYDIHVPYSTRYRKVLPQHFDGTPGLSRSSHSKGLIVCMVRNIGSRLLSGIRRHPCTFCVVAHEGCTNTSEPRCTLTSLRLPARQTGDVIATWWRYEWQDTRKT